MNLKNLTVRGKLTLVFGLFTLLLLLIGGMGIHGMRQTQASLKSVYEDRTVCLGQLGEVERRLQHIKIQFLAAAKDATKSSQTDKITVAESDLGAISKVWKEYTSTLLTPEEAALAKQYEAGFTQLQQQGIGPIIAAYRAGQPSGSDGMLDGKYDLLDAPVLKTIGDLVQLQIDVARAENAAASARYDTSFASMIGMLCVGLGAIVLSGGLIVRSLTRALGAEPNELGDVAKRVASGDLSPVAGATSAASGSVLASLGEMQQSLAHIVSQVRSSSDSIATGSAQIATGNSDLSQRTEEQASNLQQTAASMEQLSGSVRTGADTAREANQLAASAAAAAEQGGYMVSQVVSTMQEISTSSRKISDIIGVIDGIAFQTNILALNAAVEAARAGEQGRGFAVVAGEVRTLAQRSAEAAREIKTLIGASVDKVEAGTTQVEEAGASMTEIVNQVQRVSQMIGDVSDASGEQSQGIAQIGDAVQQLDQVTQQNAALVEETAAAAESLRHQAEQLTQLMSIFKMDGVGATSVGSPASGPAAPRAASKPATARTSMASGASSIRTKRPAASIPTPATAPVAPVGPDDWASF